MHKKYILKCFTAALIAAFVILSGCSSEVQNVSTSVSTPSNIPKNAAAQPQESGKPNSENNVSISDINVPITINGADAKVECYNIDGNIYVRLSDVGNYLNFSPYFDKNTIEVKRSKTQNYSYYKELSAVPDFETTSSTVHKAVYSSENSFNTFSENALAEFLYEASENDINNYKDILKNENFEQVATLESEFMGEKASCDIFQSERKYFVLLTTVSDSNIVLVTLTDEQIISADPPAASPEQSSQTPMPTEAANPLS